MSTDLKDYIALTAEHAKNVNTDAVAAIVKYCGVSLQNKDGRYVAASDKSETATIIKGFCAKKLGLNAEDAAAAVAAVALKMKATRMKHRVPFYYLLAEHAGKLDALLGGTKKVQVAEVKAKPVSRASSTVNQPSVTSRPSAAETVTPAKSEPMARPTLVAPVQTTSHAPAAHQASPAPIAQTTTSAQKTYQPSSPAQNDSGSGMGWLKWVLPALAALLAFWYFTGHKNTMPVETAATPPAATTTAAPAAIMIDTIDVSKNITTAMGTLTAALPTVTDAASATAALPKLQEAGTAIAAVTGIASKFSAEQKTAVASMVNAGLPALTGLVTKAQGNAEAAGILKPVMDAIIGNLTNLTK